MSTIDIIQEFISEGPLCIGEGTMSVLKNPGSLLDMLIYLKDPNDCRKNVNQEYWQYWKALSFYITTLYIY